MILSLAPRRIAAAFAAVIFAFGVLTLAGCSSDADPEATAQVDTGAVTFGGDHVDAATFTAATEVPGVIVVDVRTPAEFAAGHLPGALNVDVESPDFANQVAALDPDAEYAVYCRSGNRSVVAIDQMTDAGVTNTVGLSGGIGAWTGEVVTG